VSEEEQDERLKERMEDPTKKWKYNRRDHFEASLREKYIRVYEDVFENCSAQPWTIIPADQNWYKEYLIAKNLVDALEKLNMKYPDLKEVEKEEIQMNQN
jgi:polyphosphate kinase 2 (PPK2 family)